MLNDYHKKRNEMMLKAVQEQRKNSLSLKEVQEQFERIRQGRKEIIISNPKKRP